MADILSQEEIDALLSATEGFDEFYDSDKQSENDDKPCIITNYEFPQLEWGVKIQKDPEVNPSISSIPEFALQRCTVSVNMAERRQRYNEMLAQDRQAKRDYKATLKETQQEIEKMRKEFDSFRQHHRRFLNFYQTHVESHAVIGYAFFILAYFDYDKELLEYAELLIEDIIEGVWTAPEPEIEEEEHEVDPLAEEMIRMMEEECNEDQSQENIDCQMEVEMLKAMEEDGEGAPMWCDHHKRFPD